MRRRICSNLRSARVDKSIAAQSRRTGVTADRVVRELARDAFANSQDVVNYDDATIKGAAARDDTAAVASVRVKTIPTKDGEDVEREVRMHDKLKALELLGRHLGMFIDKTEHSGSLDINNSFAGLTTEELKKPAGADS